MNYISTNNKQNTVSARKATLEGLAPDGGLYMPQNIPTVPRGFIEALPNLSFHEIAHTIAMPFFAPEISSATMADIVEQAFNFPAPIVKLSENISILELFHGPTLAFKDFGARFMARIMSYFTKDEDKEVVVLVATSGDTGSAVAHGFLGVENIRVVLLYPSGKVTEVQEKQFTTLGGNITALELRGVFDDCQSLVKKAFLDTELRKRFVLASANSINIARLIPQSFYYFLASGQRLHTDLPLVFSVPSGNFGNLTAGLFAKHMGLPIKRFIAATNANRTVPDYLDGQPYAPRPSIPTISNAMDVGSPSNFARILNLYNNNRESIKADICAYSITDVDTLLTIEDVYNKTGYLLDPHGAVGYLGLSKYLKDNQAADGIVLETAHPAKFLDSIVRAGICDVQLPSTLSCYLNKEKKSIRMNNSYEEFKGFLIENM